MCEKHYLFHACGCPVIDPETGEEKYEIARCRAGKLMQRPKHKIDMGLPIQSPKTFCDRPDCPAYGNLAL
ncbi:hypothetical protein DL770_010537 [Monosporascus sp. CRB-9-2]|nr:hypothetical protein DL770_010537 [Monosporascus sp. CRB-9-2]